MRFAKVMKWSMLVSGILLVVLGALTLVTPVESLIWLAVIISAVVLVSGITELVSYFRADRRLRSGWMLAEAVITILLGVWLVFGSGSWVLTAAIPYIFAGLVMAGGIVRIAESLDIRAEGVSSWGWLLAWGILTIALGAVCIFYPAASVTMLAVMISLMLIGHGLSNITMFANMQRIGSFIRKRVARLEME